MNSKPSHDQQAKSRSTGQVTINRPCHEQQAKSRARSHASQKPCQPGVMPARRHASQGCL